MISISTTDGRAFRPAGYRRPKPGELYIGKTGAVKRAQANSTLDEDRLIVRCTKCEERGCDGNTCES